MPSSVRGIDHIGITVPDIEKATLFFERAFGAQVLYHSVDAETDNIDQAAQQHTLKLFPGTKIHAIRMLVMPHGPGINFSKCMALNRECPPAPATLASSILLFMLMILIRR